jgi:hypothetical protein
MGHPRQAPRAEPRTAREAGIAVPVQEERPSTCQHAHQRLSRCLRRQRSRRCSGLTRKQLPGGRRQESSRPSGRSAVTAGTGRLRSAPYWRASRSSAQSERGPHPASPRREGWRPELRRQPAAKCQQEGGVDPGGQLTASGGALRVRCDDGHRSADVAGVDPASRASGYALRPEDFSPNSPGPRRAGPRPNGRRG